MENVERTITKEEYMQEKAYPSEKLAIHIKPDVTVNNHRLFPVSANTEIKETIRKRVEEVVQVHAQCELAIGRLKHELEEEKLKTLRLQGQLQASAQTARQFKKILQRSRTDQTNLGSSLVLAKAELERLKSVYSTLLQSHNKLAHSTVSKDLLEDYERRLKENAMIWEEKSEGVRAQLEQERQQLKQHYEELLKAVKREGDFNCKQQQFQFAERFFQLRLLLEVQLKRTSSLARQKLESETASSKSVKTLEDELHRQSQRCSDLLRECDRTRLKLDEDSQKAAKEVGQFREANKRIEEELAEARGKNSRLSEQIGELQQDRARLSRRLTEQEEETEGIRVEAERLRDELQQAKKQRSQAQSEEALARQKLSIAEQQVKHAQGKSALLEEQLDKMRKAVESLTKQVAQLVPQNEASRKAQQQSALELARKQKELREERERGDGLEKEIDQLSRRLREALAEAEQAGARFREKQKKLQLEFEFLKKQLQQAEQCLKEREERLKKAAAEQEGQAKQKEDQTAGLLQEIERLKREGKSKQKEMDQLRQKENEIRALRRRQEELQKELADKQAGSEEADGQRRTLENRLKEERQQREDLAMRMGLKEKELEGCQVRLKELLEKLRAEGQSEREHKKASRRQEEELGQLREQIQSLLREREQNRKSIEDNLQLIAQLREGLQRGPEDINRYKRLLLEYANRLIFLQKDMDALSATYAAKLEQLQAVRAALEEQGCEKLRQEISQLKDERQCLQVREAAINSSLQQASVEVAKLGEQLALKSAEVQKLVGLCKVRNKHEQRESTAVREASHYLARLKELEERRFSSSSEEEFRARLERSKRVRAEVQRGGFPVREPSYSNPEAVYAIPEN